MRLLDFSFAGVEPEVMGAGPIPATEKLLARNSMTMDDIGLIEINEAFAVQVLAFLDHFKIADDDPRVNPCGGAIALGRPLASSGVRLMMQLARELAEHPRSATASPRCASHRPGRDELRARFPDEVVTRARVRDVELPYGAGTLALITLDNGHDHAKPATFGPAGLLELDAALDAVAARATPEAGSGRSPRSASPASRSSSRSAPTSRASR